MTMAWRNGLATIPRMRSTILALAVLVGCGTTGDLTRDGSRSELTGMSVRNSCDKCGAITIDLIAEPGQADLAVTGYFSYDTAQWPERDIRIGTRSDFVASFDANWTSRAQGHTMLETLTTQVDTEVLRNAMHHEHTTLYVCEARVSRTEKLRRYATPKGCSAYPLLRKHRERLIEVLSQQSG